MGDQYDDMISDPQNAAISVAVMIAVMGTLLWGMKKSGFKAMVAVGKG